MRGTQLWPRGPTVKLLGDSAEKTSEGAAFERLLINRHSCGENKKKAAKMDMRHKQKAVTWAQVAAVHKDWLSHHPNSSENTESAAGFFPWMEVRSIS